MRRAQSWGILWLLLLAAFFAGLFFLMAEQTDAACVRYQPAPPHEPTGIKGCEVYGEGIASQWGGPGVARNDCVWPWTDCQPLRITSLETGISVEVVPQMYCDCYTGTADERIVDLDPITLDRLGLDPARGLHPVRVEAVGLVRDDLMLPDTAMDR